MPKNSLFALIGAVALVLAPGCARFPDDGGIGNFTRISFRFRVQGKINDANDESPLTQYVYIVAIRTLTTDDIPNTGAPSPVIGDNTPNGFVAGSPTHFVLYDSTRPAQPFTLFKFNPGPTPGDPDNPVNLSSWFDTTPTRGRIINFVRPQDGDPAELQFDLFANQLVDSDADADTIRRIQVNILTMTRLSTTPGGTRIWDSIGNSQLPSEINAFLNVDLRGNSVVNNQLNTEPTGDTVAGNDPDIDLTDFRIEVERP